MHYLLYRITNKISNKIYIGCHKTNNIDDGYLGSGKLMKQAIKKYGKESFIKEIIGEYNSVEEMLLAENNIVNEDFVKRDDTYNLIIGGTGAYKEVVSEEVAQKISNTRKRKIKSGEITLGMKGKKHSEETKRKMSQAARGRKKSNNTKRKISESLSSQWKDPNSVWNKKEYREKLSVAKQGYEGHMKGKKHSEETKKKMSDAHLVKGFKHTEETKRKISETKRRKHDETIRGNNH